jgi:hypothetical protein
MPDWNGKYCVLAKPIDPTSMTGAIVIIFLEYLFSNII